MNNPFCNCEESHDDSKWACADPKMIIEAIEDAQKEMNYSNYHNDKFDKAIECVKCCASETDTPNKFIGLPNISTWVSVRHELPEDFERVITLNNVTGDMKVSSIQNSNITTPDHTIIPMKTWSDDVINCQVTHWIPLPEID
jgi:hypothetical protein